MKTEKINYQEMSRMDEQFITRTVDNIKTVPTIDELMNVGLKKKKDEILSNIMTDLMKKGLKPKSRIKFIKGGQEYRGVVSGTVNANRKTVTITIDTDSVADNEKKFWDDKGKFRTPPYTISEITPVEETNKKEITKQNVKIENQAEELNVDNNEEEDINFDEEEIVDFDDNNEDNYDDNE